MNEDTNETTIEQALANDDFTTNRPPFSNAVTSQSGMYSSQITFSASANPYPTYNPSTVNLIPTCTAGTYIQPSQTFPQSQTIVYGTAQAQPLPDVVYANLSPSDLATLRTMIREEVQSLKAELVKQIKEELVRNIRMQAERERI